MMREFSAQKSPVLGQTVHHREFTSTDGLIHNFMPLENRAWALFLPESSFVNELSGTKKISRQQTASTNSATVSITGQTIWDPSLLSLQHLRGSLPLISTDGKQFVGRREKSGSWPVGGEGHFLTGRPVLL
jgi:hypothetical protein